MPTAKCNCYRTKKLSGMEGGKKAKGTFIFTKTADRETKKWTRRTVEKKNEPIFPMSR